MRLVLADAATGEVGGVSVFMAVVWMISWRSYSISGEKANYTIALFLHGTLKNTSAIEIIDAYRPDTVQDTASP